MLLVSLHKGNLFVDMCRYPGRMSCELEATDISVASTREGTPKIANEPPETREGMWNRESPSQPQKESTLQMP